MSYESDQAAKRAAYARGMLNDEAYSLQSRPRSEADTRRSAALHSAEREVLEACVRELKAFDAMRALPGQTSALVERMDAVRDRFAKVRRYREMLDGKEAT